MPSHTLPDLTFTLDPTSLKHWTVADYHRLSEIGLLDPTDRTELIAGQITLMAAKGTPHVLALRLLSGVLNPLLAEQPVFVSLQDPIQLDDFSEPEPDLAIVQGTMMVSIIQHCALNNGQIGFRFWPLFKAQCWIMLTIIRVPTRYIWWWRWRIRP